MPASLDLSQKTKVKSLGELSEVLEEDRRRGLKIVQCHGVFDLLHPGHIRHFQQAKALGDRLVVTVTPDRFVNKGPGRPAFPEAIRIEALAALQIVDYVALNDSPDAVSAIRKVRPHFYVKGLEYKNHSEDTTGKIAIEAQAAAAFGGVMHYTDDVVFSSSSLLNKYLDPMPPQTNEFLCRLKARYPLGAILQMIEDLSQLNVLVVGDAIIDEYQYTLPLGQSGKGLHMVAGCREKETFLGGSLIIANHVAQFAGKVTLAAALGRECPHLPFIRKNLDSKIIPQILYLEEAATLVKKRYVLKDGPSLTKLFETYSSHAESLPAEQTDQIINFLKQSAARYDLILICDFGNGFTNPRMIEALSDLPAFLALNTQTNSGNRGYNVVTNYRRADYISINEPELRLAAHDKSSSLDGLAADICQVMHCNTMSVTQGIGGVYCYSSREAGMHIPAFATTAVDRIGAGDSYLALSSLCAVKRYPPMIAGFIGSAAAALSVQMVGNQEAIQKAALCKFVTRMLK